MIDQLFGSKTRVKLLKLFYSNPNRSFYVREITRKIDEQINSVRRELANLLSIGIITSDDSKNKVYYEVNQDFEMHNPLAEMFGGKPIAAKSKKASKENAKDKEEQVVADEPTLTEEQKDVAAIGNVELALLTGQFTRDETAGVDLVIVGNVNQTNTDKYIKELEKKEGKELRYAVMDLKEFQYRKQVKDRFINGLFMSKYQVLIDKHKILEEK
ncbi:MAG: transcriptional regulator [bacterium]|nr:transcriptional regulator [bacterium]